MADLVQVITEAGEYGVGTLYFSRVPVVGEVMIINKEEWKVMSVEHMPWEAGEESGVVAVIYVR